MYSRKVKELLMSPINGRKGGVYNGEGKYEGESRCSANPNRTSTNTVFFKVAIEDSGIIRDARWRVFGDPVTIATASWCVKELVGKKVEDIANFIIPERAALALDINDVSDIRGGCTTAIRAVANAFDDYRNRRLKD